MPWCDVLGEEGRDPAHDGRAMAISSVQIDRPQEDDGEDLVLAEAMGGLAESVVFGMSVCWATERVMAVGTGNTVLTYHAPRD